jgi:molybdopterin molybdotransferase
MKPLAADSPLHRLEDLARAVEGYDAQSMPVQAAQQFIARLVTPVTAVEHLPLRSALGRVLAQDLISPINVPAHDNSAMDGYALRGEDIGVAQLGGLRVAGTAFAGGAFEGSVPSGHCVRIMTGAVMPAGLDTVVPQEFTALTEDGAMHIVAGSLRPGENRRLAGEDLAQGGVALPAGRLISPADLGLAASLGRPELPVRRRLRVAFFSTGDELRSVGEALDEGCVYDSNRYTLHGMLQRLGVELLDLGVVRDDPVALETAFREAAASADAVITSGGVSVGEADHTKQIMARLGEVLFWRIAMRPGRPMAIGRIAAEPAAPAGRQAILFGLPGNPVAVMVTFYAFVRDALWRMAGASVEPLPMLRARCLTPMRKKPGRTEYQRGIVRPGAQGWEVEITGAQGSGILSSMSVANGLVVLQHEGGSVDVGDEVEVLPFYGLI